MKLMIPVLSALLLSAPVFAEDHAPASMTGEKIELFERNHAFAGAILDTPAFGVFEHEGFKGKIQLRRGEKNLVLELAASAERKHAGTLSEERTDATTGVKTTLTTDISFVKVEMTGATEGKLHFTLDGQPFTVTVTGKTFSDGHFHEPKFSAELGGKTVSFDFTGESCFGYSANIAMMIYGSYAHLMK